MRLNIPNLVVSLTHVVLFLMTIRPNALSKQYFTGKTRKDMYFRRLLDIFYPLLPTFYQSKINKSLWENAGFEYQNQHDCDLSYTLDTKAGAYQGEAYLAGHLIDNFDSEYTYCEIGCGNGRFITFLADCFESEGLAPKALIGIDMNDECTRVGQKHHKTLNLKFDTGDALSIFEKLKGIEKVVIISIGVLPYLNPQEFQKFLNQVRLNNWDICLRESAHSSKTYQGSLRWKHDYKKLLGNKGFELTLKEGLKGFKDPNSVIDVVGTL